MARKRKQYEDDDGHVITSMNVEGMPWHRPEQPQGVAEGPEQLNRHETLLVMFSAMKWALLFALLFSGLMVLFVLFCAKVWFRG